MENILRQCALFDGIDPAECSAMLGCLGARRVSYDRGATVLLEGGRADQVGVVLSGSVHIVQEDYYGNRSIVAAIGPAQLFGETFACAGVESLPVSVICAEKCEILLIDCRRITMSCSNSCEFHSRMVLNLLRVVAEKNLLFNRKIRVMSKKTTREKLMAYLLDQAKEADSNDFVIPLDRQGLADYIGVERSALSAEIGKLRREGIIESERSRFRLLGEEGFRG